MKLISSWETLLEVAHPLAREKGWWDDMDRPIDEQVANFHAEISEAWEEYRSGRMETWYSLGGKPFLKSGNNEDGCPVFYDGRDDSRTPVKPEGFWVEIADLIVRLADTCGRYGWKAVDESTGILSSPFPVKPNTSFICFLHEKTAEFISDLEGWDEFAELNAGELVTEAVAMARLHGVDLWPIVNEKVAYNRTRPHRHGGKAA